MLPASTRMERLSTWQARVRKPCTRRFISRNDLFWEPEANIRHDHRSDGDRQAIPYIPRLATLYLTPDTMFQNTYHSLMRILTSHRSRICSGCVPQQRFHWIQGALQYPGGTDHYQVGRVKLHSCWFYRSLTWTQRYSALCRLPGVCQGSRRYWFPQRCGTKLVQGSHRLEGGHAEDRWCFVIG